MRRPLQPEPDRRLVIRTGDLTLGHGGETPPAPSAPSRTSCAPADRGIPGERHMILRLLLHLLLNALSIYLAAELLAGVEITSCSGALVVAIVRGILNALVRPVLLLLTLPVTILTLGLFTLVVNGVVFGPAAYLTDALQVSGLGMAIIGAMVVAVL